MVTIRQWIRNNGEGIFMGATGGLIFTAYLASIGADLNFVMQQQSVFDDVIGTGIALKNIAITKAGIIFMSLGAVIGAFVDSMFGK